jgi:hypothetical protein
VDCGDAQLSDQDERVDFCGDPLHVQQLRSPDSNRLSIEPSAQRRFDLWVGYENGLFLQ